MTRTRRPMRTALHRLGPLAPIAAWTAAALVVCSASRLLLAAVHLDRLRVVPHWWWAFVVGVRMDLAVVAIACTPAAVVALLPERPRRAAAGVVATWLAGCAAVLVFLEAATLPFVAQYDSRPNRIFFEYLAYPREVLGTLLADYKLALAVALAATALAAVATWRATARLGRRPSPLGVGQRLVIAPLLLGLLFVGMRGGVGHRPANISTAAFSDDHLANELGLDSAYSLGYAIWSRKNEVAVASVYGSMSDEEALARVRRASLLPPAAFTDPALPLLHASPEPPPAHPPYNLVIILEESLGAEYVGALGGLPLTPALDALASDGLLFTNLYATGTRTVRGIEAVVSGFLPTPGTSVVKLGLAQRGFFTIAELLRRAGYATEFLYGGRSNFDNMASFFLGNGFERVIDEPAFDHPVLRGTWGVSDEDLFRRANRRFAAHGDRPFCALLLTTSNHPPYEFPADRIALFEQPANTGHNAIKYADWALGQFFRAARREPWFDRTVFLVVADHDTRVWGLDLVPIVRFHVPALVLGPGVPAGRYDGLASQVDLLPTVLPLVGVSAPEPLIGRDLLAVPPGVPGHAFMQYDVANAYRVGDRVVIHEPYQRPRQFSYATGRLVEMPLDPELARDALAHVTLPERLYEQQRYHLPAADAVQARPAIPAG